METITTIDIIFLLSRYHLYKHIGPLGILSQSNFLGVAITAMLIQFFRDYYSTEIFSPEGIKIFQRTLFVLAVIGSLSIFQAMSLKNDEGRDALTNK